VMMRNSIRVALCRARDEVEGRHTASAGKAGRFNIGNFRKAEAEVARMMRSPTSTGTWLPSL